MSISRRKSALEQKLNEFQKLLSDTPGGRHLRAWCDRMVERRISVLIVILAQTVVRCVDGLYVLGEIVREGMTSWAGSCGPIEEWEEMYRRSRAPLRRVLDQFGEVPRDWLDFIGIPEESGPVKVGTALRCASLLGRSLQRSNKDELDQEIREYSQSPAAAADFAKGQELMRKCYDDSLSGGIAAHIPEDQADACLVEKETQFFLLVWLPCWLEYGESASQLLQRAEMRDLGALEELLRLDKRVIFFSRIRGIVEDANRNRMEGSFALQADAFSGKPKTLWKRDGVRVAMSKYILGMSKQVSAIHPELLGPSLTRRDIFEAFHAVARDRGLKRDQTLPVDEESFCKRITREKRFGTATAWDIF